MIYHSQRWKDYSCSLIFSPQVRVASQLDDDNDNDNEVEDEDHDDDNDDEVEDEDHDNDDDDEDEDDDNDDSKAAEFCFWVPTCAATLL